MRIYDFLRATLLAVVVVSSFVAIHPAGAAAPGSAPFSSAGTTEADAARFLASLQSAVREDDRNKVADLVHYPARMWNGSRTIIVRSRATLLARYPAIFNADLRRAILAANPAALWANARGVMFADGQVWFAPLQGAGLGIIAINRPLPSH